MIVSTTSEIQGREVEQYLGLVFGEIVLGTSLFADTAAGWTDLFGKRSGAYEKKMTQARHDVLSQIEARAGELGADAILGVRLDYETIGQSMMMLSASGTAVRLNPDPMVGASTAAQKRKAELWAYWDHTASTWAEIDEYLGKVTEPVSTELLRSGGVSGGKAVLDVGCGTGDLTVAAARAVGNGRVFALDISQAMLRLAQSKAQGVSNIEFLVEDIQSVTNLDGAIDVAICRFSLPLFDDPREALKRIAQSVKVGGRIAVAVWGPPASNGFLSAPIEALRTIGVQSPGPLSRAFALSDESVLNEALQSAGFRDCKGVAIQMSLQAPNSYRYWNFIRQYFSDIRTFSPAVQDSLRQEIARMIALPPTTALTFSAQALVYSATK